MTEPSTEPAPSTIPVLAAVIESDGRHLLGRRPGHKRHGGLWEFPGGKLHAGEDLAAAARRELREELGVEVVGVGEPLYRAMDPASSFEIIFVPTEIRGTPTAIEHDELGWFELTGGPPAGVELAPADRAFVEQELAG